MIKSNEGLFCIIVVCFKLKISLTCSKVESFIVLKSCVFFWKRGPWLFLKGLQSSPWRCPVLHRRGWWSAPKVIIWGFDTFWEKKHRGPLWTLCSFLDRLEVEKVLGTTASTSTAYSRNPYFTAKPKHVCRIARMFNWGSFHPLPNREEKTNRMWHFHSGCEAVLTTRWRSNGNHARLGNLQYKYVYIYVIEMYTKVNMPYVVTLVLFISINITMTWKSWLKWGWDLLQIEITQEEPASEHLPNKCNYIFMANTMCRFLLQMKPLAYTFIH